MRLANKLLTENRNSSEFRIMINSHVCSIQKKRYTKKMDIRLSKAGFTMKRSKED